MHQTNPRKLPIKKKWTGAVIILQAVGVPVQNPSTCPVPAINEPCKATCRPAPDGKADEDGKALMPRSPTPSVVAVPSPSGIQGRPPVGTCFNHSDERSFRFRTP